MRPMPAWGRVKTAPTSDREAAFAAGASRAALDAVLRPEPVFSGVWRQRLALSAAAATPRLIGRRENEAALRDAWCFRAAGDDPGPSGQILQTWRQLAQRSSGWPAKGIKQAAKALDLDLDDRAGEFVRLLESRAQVEGSPIADAPALSEAVVLRFPQLEVLARHCHIKPVAGHNRIFPRADLASQVLDFACGTCSQKIRLTSKSRFR
jgi:hypothetical protein